MADPIKHYPDIFKPGGFLEEYPYALPNLFAAGVLFIGILIGVLFLEETHAELKQRKDYGLDFGKKLTGILTRLFYKGLESAEDRRKLLAGNAEIGDAGYHTFPDQSPVVVPVEEEPMPLPKPLSVQKTFTPQVIHVTISYGILALHTIVFSELYPIFLSTPRADHPPSSVFKFVGGLGLQTPEVGSILAVQGVLAMLIQFAVFPPLVSRFGIFSVYRVSMLFFPISYFVVPYLDFVPKHYSYASTFIPLTIQILFAAMAYPCNMILLTNSAPSFLELGTINGFAASMASLSRCFGPILSGMIYTYGLQIGRVGLAWWVNTAVCAVGALQALWILNPSEKVDPVPNVTAVDEEESTV